MFIEILVFFFKFWLFCWNFLLFCRFFCGVYGYDVFLFILKCYWPTAAQSLPFSYFTPHAVFKHVFFIDKTNLRVFLYFWRKWLIRFCLSIVRKYFCVPNSVKNLDSERFTMDSIATNVIHSLGLAKPNKSRRQKLIFNLKRKSVNVLACMLLYVAVFQPVFWVRNCWRNSKIEFVTAVAAGDSVAVAKIFWSKKNLQQFCYIDIVYLAKIMRVNYILLIDT